MKNIYPNDVAITFGSKVAAPVAMDTLFNYKPYDHFHPKFNIREKMLAENSTLVRSDVFTRYLYIPSFTQRKHKNLHKLRAEPVRW